MIIGKSIHKYAIGTLNSFEVNKDEIRAIITDCFDEDYRIVIPHAEEYAEINTHPSYSDLFFIQEVKSDAFPNPNGIVSTYRSLIFEEEETLVTEKNQFHICIRLAETPLHEVKKSNEDLSKLFGVGIAIRILEKRQNVIPSLNDIFEDGDVQTGINIEIDQSDDIPNEIKALKVVLGLIPKNSTVYYSITYDNNTTKDVQRELEEEFLDHPGTTFISVDGKKDPLIWERAGLLAKMHRSIQDDEMTFIKV